MALLWRAFNRLEILPSFCPQKSRIPPRQANFLDWFRIQRTILLPIPFYHFLFSLANLCCFFQIGMRINLCFCVIKKRAAICSFAANRLRACMAGPISIVTLYKQLIGKRFCQYEKSNCPCPKWTFPLL